MCLFILYRYVELYLGQGFLNFVIEIFNIENVVIVHLYYIIYLLYTAILQIL